MRRHALRAAGLAAALAAGCAPVRHPGIQVRDTKSVLTTTTPVELPGGQSAKLTVPHGSRSTSYAAVLLVGDWSVQPEKDEAPGSQSVLRDVAEALAEAGYATLRVSDWPGGGKGIEAAWAWLQKSRIADPGRIAVFVQGDAAYRALPLLRRFEPRALVLLGCPARPFAKVALDRLPAALRATGGATRAEDARAALERWLAGGPRPSGSWARGVLGSAPPGYYEAAFRLEPATAALPGPGLPALVLRGADDAWSFPEDASALAALTGTEVTELPLADHRGKASAGGVPAAPDDPVVPDVAEAVVALLDPVLRPHELLER